MPSIEKVLKAEIQRLAKKEAKAATADLKKASVSYRSTIADFRRRIAKLERDSKKLRREVAKSGEATGKTSDEEVERARITGQMVRSVRTRLGLSQADFAELVDVSKNTVYKWETQEGKLRFRGDAKAKIVAARKMTKAEAWGELGYE